MSLYYEAAAVLTNAEAAGGSLKNRIFGKKDAKSSPAAIFALVSETTKWSELLSEVVEKSGVLRVEKKVRECVWPHMRRREPASGRDDVTDVIVTRTIHSSRPYSPCYWHTTSSWPNAASQRPRRTS